MNRTKKSIIELPFDKFTEELVNNGYEKYRSEQIYEWIFKRFIFDFDGMTNLKKEMRDKLHRIFKPFGMSILNKYLSEDKKTEKYLIRLEDNLKIETVLLKQQKGRNTICLSSQVGCQLGCRFCATGQKMPFRRSLETYEIVGQLLLLLQEGVKFDNIVFMGMGEPFLNYENVMNAIKLMNKKETLNIGFSRITVSTAGITSGIRKFASENKQLTLAVSLNSLSDVKRSKIMPVNKKENLKMLFKALKQYQNKTNNIITFEYILIKDFNMSLKDAYAVRTLSKDFKCKINIIPLNSVPKLNYSSPETKEIKQFVGLLSNMGVKVTQRYKRGRDINAACGQLAC